MSNKSSCTFIGPLWVFFSGAVPPFEPCCVEHDIGYRIEELELAHEEGWLLEYEQAYLGSEPSRYLLELALAVEDGWGREYADLQFKECIEGSFSRETWWDEVCFLGVRFAGWFYYKSKRLIRKIAPA